MCSGSDPEVSIILDALHNQWGASSLALKETCIALFPDVSSRKHEEGVEALPPLRAWLHLLLEYRNIAGLSTLLQLTGEICSASCGWWLVLICCERKTLLAGWWFWCWFGVKKALLADKPAEQCSQIFIPAGLGKLTWSSKIELVRLWLKICQCAV